MTADLNTAAAALIVAANAIDPDTVSADQATNLIGQIVPATKCPTTLAAGTERESHSKRAMQQRAGKTAPRQPVAEPEVKAARKAKVTVTNTGKDTFKVATAPKAKATGSRIVLKTNKEVRAQLTAAAQKLGGTRLVPVGAPFGENYTTFLAGFDAVDQTIDFRAVKGSEKQPGRVTLLVAIKDGQPSFKVSTTKK